MLYPDKDFAGYQRPHVLEHDHWGQFVKARPGQGRTSADFDYAGLLTETVLLGGVAYRHPQTTLHWTAKDLQFDNLADANQSLRRDYRSGWSVKGLS